jgi:hypothetical protein
MLAAKSEGIQPQEDCKMKKLATLVFSLALAGVLVAPRAKADEWNKKTFVTFNEPVEIPGRVLTPGTYVFKLLDSQADRDIVQIFNKDESQLYATILAIPDYRLTPTGKTVIKFEERKSDTPEAIRAWFYPGNRYGFEFVYPQARATQLAAAYHQPVMSMPNEMSKHLAKPAKSVNEPQVAAMRKTPVTPIAPKTMEQPPVQVAQNTPPPAPKMPAAAPRRLPQTGSNLPLVGLLGLLALGTGGGLKIFSSKFD